MKSYFHLFLFLFGIFSAVAAEKNPVPRFASLKSNEVNVRVGPGPNYPVEWIYLKAGFPVEIIAEFDTWRKIRDREGTEGWVHKTMLYSKRHALVQPSEVLLYTQPDAKSCPVIRLQQGVVVDLLKCPGEWCQVRIYDFKGWVKRDALWGLYPKEIIK